MRDFWDRAQRWMRWYISYMHRFQVRHTWGKWEIKSLYTVESKSNFTRHMVMKEIHSIPSPTLLLSMSMEHLGHDAQCLLIFPVCHDVNFSFLHSHLHVRRLTNHSTISLQADRTQLWASKYIDIVHAGTTCLLKWQRSQRHAPREYDLLQRCVLGKVNHCQLVASREIQLDQTGALLDNGVNGLVLDGIGCKVQFS